MKTKEELNKLKEEVKTLNKKLAELSEEELKQVTGGFEGFHQNSAEQQGGAIYFNSSIVGNPAESEVGTGKNRKSVNVNEVLT